LASKRKLDLTKEDLEQMYGVGLMSISDIAKKYSVTAEYIDHLFLSLGVNRSELKCKYPRKTYKISMPREDLYDMYINKVMPCYEICEVYGCDASAVNKRLKDYGIPVRHHNDTKRGKKSHNRISVDEPTVIENYLTMYESCQSTADKFGVTRDVIARVLRENNIQLKPKGECRDLRGEKSPTWKPELTQEHRENGRDMSKHKVWRDAIYKRDDYKCQRCGYSGNLTAHHIVGHAQSKELRWVLSNGVTLCKPCHVEFHSTYGIKKFGNVELDEFMRAYIDAK
jgi:hypothetical protein